MKRHYWVFLFVVLLGITSVFFASGSEVYAVVAARPAAQDVVAINPDQLAYRPNHSTGPVKYGECIRPARRIAADCLR